MRLLKHLFAPSARRLFPERGLQRITAAIADSERRHGAEICFAVEPALAASAVAAGVQARDRAREVFARLGVWDTAANNGVLLYLLLADRRIEIVADRGFDGRVDDAQWRDVCGRIEQGMHAGDPVQAVVDGVAAISSLVEPLFPRDPDVTDTDELPNRPRLL